MKYRQQWRVAGSTLLFVVCLLWLPVAGYSYTTKYTKSGFSYIYVSQQQENVAPKEQQEDHPASGSRMCIVTGTQPAMSNRQNYLHYYPRKSEGICFHRHWFVCVCLSVCL